MSHQKLIDADRYRRKNFMQIIRISSIWNFLLLRIIPCSRKMYRGIVNLLDRWISFLGLLKFYNNVQILYNHIFFIAHWSKESKFFCFFFSGFGMLHELLLCFCLMHSHWSLHRRVVGHFASKYPSIGRLNVYS